MGSFLNFVFLSDNLEKNGGDDFQQGPMFIYITERNRYSYTLNGQLKEGYKNILMMEGVNTLESFLNLDNFILEFIKTNDVKLLAVSLADPTIKEKYFNVLNYLNKKIGKDKYIVFDSNMRLSECFNIQYFLEEATWDKKTFFDSEKNDLNYFSEEIKQNELDLFKNKKFISFNRNIDKHHRASLFHEWINNDYSDSYFSFINNIEYVNEIVGVGKIKDLNFYNSKLPIELDTFETDNKFYFRTTNTFKKELFLNSCINIVTETSCFFNELFISEKILKPILNYQPFIVLGPYQYLRELKKYGFKTFSEVWDESYDEIINPYERIPAVISLINNLNKKTIQEFNEIYQKIKNICIYNRELFDSLELDSFPQIFKKIENEW